MASKKISLVKSTRPKPGDTTEDAVTPGQVLTGPGGGFARNLYDFVKVSQRAKHFYFDSDAHADWHQIVLEAIRNEDKVKVKYGTGNMTRNRITYKEATNVREA